MTSGSRRHFTITVEMGTPVSCSSEFFHSIANSVGDGINKEIIEALGLEVIAYTVKDHGVVD